MYLALLALTCSSGFFFKCAFKRTTWEGTSFSSMNILTVLTVNKLSSLFVIWCQRGDQWSPDMFLPKAWAQKRLFHRVGSTETLWGAQNSGWILLPCRSPTSVATCLSQPWSNIVAAIHQTELMGENNICSYVGTASFTWLKGSRIFSPKGDLSNRFTSPRIFLSFSGDKALRFACLSRFRLQGLLHSWQNRQFSTVQSCLFLQSGMPWQHRKVRGGPCLPASGSSSALPFCTSSRRSFGSTLFVEVASSFAKHKGSIYNPPSPWSMLFIVVYYTAQWRT